MLDCAERNAVFLVLISGEIEKSVINEEIFE